MKRLSFTAAGLAVLAFPHVADAQTPTPVGSNLLSTGLYVEGIVGLNVLEDLDLDINTVADDATIKSKVGAFGAVAAGFNLPQGPLNLRLEGELSIRGNKLDEFEFANGDVRDGIDDSVTNAYAAMANAHLDYYFTPNIAATVGAGVGYANVEVDTIVDNGAVNLRVFDEEDDSAFAYQGRVGARYTLTSNLTASLAYTYFATGELEIEDATGATESTFNYVSHAFHGGLAFHF